MNFRSWERGLLSQTLHEPPQSKSPASSSALLCARGTLISWETMVLAIPNWPNVLDVLNDFAFSKWRVADFRDLSYRIYLSIYHWWRDLSFRALMRLSWRDVVLQARDHVCPICWNLNQHNDIEFEIECSYVQIITFIQTAGESARGLWGALLRDVVLQLWLVFLSCWNLNQHNDIEFEIECSYVQIITFIQTAGESARGLWGALLRDVVLQLWLVFLSEPKSTQWYRIRNRM